MRNRSNYMTTQIPDIIIINYVSFSLYKAINSIEREEASPLNKYLEQYNSNLKFDIQASYCWRGYVATWEIKDDCFYLKDISGKINSLDIKLYQLFKSQEVKAIWFIGSIRIAISSVNYIVFHTGYTSTVSPKNIRFYIENGRVVNRVLEETIYNEDDLNILSEKEKIITEEEMTDEILSYKAMIGRENMPIEIYYADADYNDDLLF